MSSGKQSQAKGAEAVELTAAPAAADVAVARKSDPSGAPGFRPAVEALKRHANPVGEGEAGAMLSAMAECATLDGVVPTKNPVNFIESLIRRLDEELTKQVNEVVHAPEFLKLEGTWRGLQRLLKDTDTNKTLWVEVLDASKSELQQDFADAADYSGSALWKRAYEGRYDLSGGHPVGAFVGGYEFANTPMDIRLLESLSQVGAGVQAPFILSAAPELLGVRSFDELKHVDDLKNRFTAPEFTKWNALRKNPDSRFLALTLPRVQARMPYGENLLDVKDKLFKYQEAPVERGQLKRMPHHHFCWSSSAYAMGGVLTKAFRNTNWCTAIIGDERQKKSGGTINGGKVGGLEVYTYYNEGGNAVDYPPTETVIPGHKEFALAELGLLPLSYEIGSDSAVFLGGKTMFEPQGRPGTENFKNDFVASVLSNVLPASRISHFVKAIGRKFHGRFATKDQIQRFLENWLANFKTDPGADEEGKSKYPLQNFTVQVTDGWAPGVYDVAVKLRFWEMIYQINADVAMVADVDNQAAS